MPRPGLAATAARHVALPQRNCRLVILFMKEFFLFDKNLCKIQRSETILKNSIFCDSLFNPDHLSDPSNHQETVPFWCSFI